MHGSQDEPYGVFIDWSSCGEDGTLYVDCDCPRFQGGNLCKHVAALILAVDREKLGDQISGSGPLLVFPEWMRDGEEVISRPGNGSKLRATLPLAASSLHGIDRATGTGEQRKSGRSGAARRASKPLRQPPKWTQQLARVAGVQLEDLKIRSESASRRAKRPGRLGQIWYVLDTTAALERGWPVVTLQQRLIKKNGQTGKLKSLSLLAEDIYDLADPQDRAIIGTAVGSNLIDSHGSYSDFEDKFKGFSIAPVMYDVVLPQLQATGRFGWSPDGETVLPLAWDDGPEWLFRLVISKSADGSNWIVRGELARGAEVEPLSSAIDLLFVGLLVFRDRIARFEARDALAWAAMLRGTGELVVPVKQELDFVEQLALMPATPQGEWPPELRWEDSPVTPIPALKVVKSKHRWETNLEGMVTWRYGDLSARPSTGLPGWFNRTTRRVVRRNMAAEISAKAQLLRAGAYDAYSMYQSGADVMIPPRNLSRLVDELAAQGWNIEAEGVSIRRASNFKISVTSGVDWFDLDGVFDFDGVSASLPELLASLARGDRFVRLGDGSKGMLPSEWLEQFGPLAELGKIEGNRLKFAPSQGALLDALLAAQPPTHVTIDKQFQQVRDRLRSFDGIAPRKEPSSFQGKLRPYQREGLGWLEFLDEFGFGGCLADDMGLGKTVQVLAMLEERRRAKARAGRNGKQGAATPSTSLVVAPRSLVFNWIEEARRFTPQLSVLNYTGLGREESFANLAEHDLAITTYGTLRRDVAKLSQFEFDYAILDEAQAIKNGGSQSAKACRLLRARRRLAMSGTPVENHLDELWSLFEFLNPGMLGRNSKLSQLFSRKKAGGEDDEESASSTPAAGAQAPPENVSLLAKAVRPFLLRRTKQQVLKDLPDKTEQTLYCELDDKERKRYEELRKHYQQSLAAKIDQSGLQKSKIHVLEALLRLRQAACHPGLLDKTKIKESSAKLDTVLEQLSEVVSEGHKALVFSQFTSLLAIVRDRLDKQGIVYEYLDGRTAKRQQKVERFQSDPDCPLFLISLKAGGQGLNLTAADYVFILDPWWNPAVEAQAVDRAHRMGQTRRVFAYRLIAKDTVEEKILQLQDRKRNLAEAIVSADNSLLRNLTAEDLQLLLS